MNTSTYEEIHRHDDRDASLGLGEPSLEDEWCERKADSDTAEEEESIELSLAVVLKSDRDEPDRDRQEHRSEDGGILGLKVIVDTSAT